MAIYLGNKKVSTKSGYVTNTGLKDLFNNGVKFAYSDVASYNDFINYSDTENVEDMENLFYQNINLIDFPNIDFSKATRTQYMFYEAKFTHAGPINTSSSLINTVGMFEKCANLKDVQILDMSNVIYTGSMFRDCKSLETLQVINIENAVHITFADYMFINCKKLSEIPAFDLTNTFSMSEIFYGCSSLKFIHCKNIGTSFYISSSTLFTREALLEIINNLQTVKETQTLTMGETNLAKLTDEDKAIATNKGWTLA